MSCSLRFRAGAALTFLAVGGLSGCGSNSPGSTASGSATSSAGTTAAGSITVFAAASLTGSFTTLGKEFETANPGTKVTFSFGASSGLAQQIIAGAPVDVFASASEKNMSQVTDAGDAANPATFATNTAAIAVNPASATKVSSLGDLGKPGVKVALCQPEVPCGALAQTVLGQAYVTVQPVTLGLDVKSTLAYVTSGEADAAIVYVTDVKAAAGKVTGVDIPASVNSGTNYPIAPVKTGKNPALAAAFLSFVLSPAGQRVLAEAGFGPP